MIVNSYTYEALLIIQNQNGSVVVLSFTKVLDKYYLQPIQNFELNDVIHLTIWNGMNKLYLSTISHSNISIFTWFGNYFDLMQVININTKKLIPFQSKGFMYLAVTGSNTLIFKYFLKFNKFLLIQRLPSSQDVSFFQLREGHFMEHFLTLSTESSTIIYKEINDHFVPFQQISSGKFIVPIILSKTIVLLTLHKDIIVIYQYDGWKFIELSTKLFEISQFRQVILCEKELLLVKNKNDKWTLKQPLWIKKTSYKGLQEEIRIWNIYVKSKVQRIIKEILNLKNSINIIKGHIRQFYVHNINRHNSQKLKNVSKQYKKLISKFQAQKIVIRKHIFVNVNAINVFMPLNIATNLTNQELIIKEMKVKHLNLTAGGILLPLNGPFSTVTGLIKIPKLKVKGGVHLQAKISGKWRRRSSPIIDISEFIVLNGDCSLKNVKIENLRCTDLIAKNTGSVKNTLSNAISLNDAIPVPLIFSSEKVKWSNTTLYGLQNWITANSQNINIILGKKHILQNVKITKFSYNNLKFPRIQDLFFKDSKLCASSIIASEIKTSLLTVDIITIKDLISLRLFGNLGKRYFINNTTVLFNPILFEIQYYYNVTAKNIFTMQINNLNLTELERLMNLWIESNIFNVSIETTDLIINTLQLPTRFNIELHKAIQNIILERNAHVYNINNINYIDFFTNTIKLKDMISLQNITFRNGFSTNHIFASYVPFNLINIRKNNNFHKKKIFENIEVNAIDLPYSFKISQNDTLVNVVVKGFASFPLEPKIKNVNDINLQKLSSEIWLAINTTILYGKSLYFKDAIIEGNFTLNNIINTLNPEVWKNISTYVLSKTKLQEIIFHASLNNVEVPILMGSNASTIISTSSDFNDMFENSLLKKKIQKVRAKWTFNQLKILGNLHAKHTINNLNFENDIMRYNSKENIVTGRKTVMVLNAENLNGYGFNKWVANALLETKKDITIKGRTKFSTAAFNTVKVSGTIMGHTMEETLSKSINQTIYVPKKIQGTINASELIINGFINDVNMTELMDHQLKKDKSIQTIKTDIALQNSLNIYGNLTIEDTYAGVSKFHTRLRFCRRDLIAMANSEKDDNGSQFLFTLGSTPDLQNKHTIFGNVTGETIYNMLKFEEALVDEITLSFKIDKNYNIEQTIFCYYIQNNSTEKDFNVSSYGEKAEEDEEESAILNKKFSGEGKSAHDHLTDPKLSS
ncbi:Peptidyl-prolyl cis-trans isomerase CWC27 like protein [Eufriesea mexicana]|uniref:Spliceosome-associated protein CWC27 homolog n=1 Tax=Eufriesea mexicana TaxID=516756 RepID=A0A310SGX3_9HYME|nr:Peptidyl-prolyl cis-trans isomerase CWC27 like protein [Eufriesea mexicana]